MNIINFILSKMSLLSFSNVSSYSLITTYHNIKHCYRHYGSVCLVLTLLGWLTLCTYTERPED